MVCTEQVAAQAGRKEKESSEAAAVLYRALMCTVRAKEKRVEAECLDPLFRFCYNGMGSPMANNEIRQSRMKFALLQMKFRFAE